MIGRKNIGHRAADRLSPNQANRFSAPTGVLRAEKHAVESHLFPLSDDEQSHCVSVGIFGESGVRLVEERPDILIRGIKAAVFLPTRTEVEIAAQDGVLLGSKKRKDLRQLLGAGWRCVRCVMCSPGGRWRTSLPSHSAAHAR